MHLTRRTLPALAAAGLLAACAGPGSTVSTASAVTTVSTASAATPASGGGGLPGTAAGTATSPGAASSPAGTPAPVTFTGAANGTTVTARLGQVVLVVLGAADQAGSTYWQFSSPAGALRTAAVTRTNPGPRTGACHLPGSGCGTVTLTARAAARGTGTISATRTTCGEAMRCPDGQGSFTLTVRVV